MRLSTGEKLRKVWEKERLRTRIHDHYMYCLTSAVLKCNEPQRGFLVSNDSYGDGSYKKEGACEIKKKHEKRIFYRVVFSRSLGVVKKIEKKSKLKRKNKRTSMFWWTYFAPKNIFFLFTLFCPLMKLENFQQIKKLIWRHISFLTYDVKTSPCINSVLSRHISLKYLLWIKSQHKSTACRRPYFDISCFRQVWLCWNAKCEMRSFADKKISEK